MDDRTIQWVATALGMKCSVDRIRNILVARNIEEYNIYLLIKAGEILNQARIDLYGEFDGELD